MIEFLQNFDLDLKKLLRLKSDLERAKRKKPKDGEKEPEWVCPISEAELDFRQVRMQKEALLCIGLFCHKIPDCANFISSYVRELIMLVLTQYKKNEHITTDERNNMMQEHAFLGHFASTAVL